MSVMSPSPLSASRWLYFSLLAGCAVVVLVGYLLYLNYNSQNALQKMSASQFRTSLNSWSEAFNYFLVERENDIRELAASDFVASYFINKSIGMSVKYGLQESRHIIERRFSHFTDATGDKKPIFSALALRDAEGAVVVFSKDANSRIEADDFDFSDNTFKIVRSTDPSHSIEALLEITASVWINEKIAGSVVGLVSIHELYRRFLPKQALQHVSESYHLVSLTNYSGLYSMICSRNLDNSMLKNYFQNEQSSWTDPSRPADGPIIPDSFEIIRFPFDKDGLELIWLVDKSLLYHTGEPHRFLLVFGTIVISVMACAFIAGKQYVKSLSLVSRLDIFTKLKEQIEKKNVALLDEMKQRQAIEEELRELNEHLEKRVRERSKELNKALSRIFLQEKLASIGHMAAGIAHELNNPINFVQINFNTLQTYFDHLLKLIFLHRKVAAESSAPSHYVTALSKFENQIGIDSVLEDIPVMFDESRQGFGRIAAIIEAMRNFSRKEQQNVTDVDLNKCINDTLIISRYEYKYCAVIEKHLQNISTVEGIAEQLNQVFLNLVVNAVHAIKGAEDIKEGRIIIRTWQESNHVCCSIEDNGTGIEKKDIPYIFEPFYTTKPPGKGTGLGLSISYDIIVLRHKGDILVEKKKDSGTRFTVKIPIAARRDLLLLPVPAVQSE